MDLTYNSQKLTMDSARDHLEDQGFGLRRTWGRAANPLVFVLSKVIESETASGDLGTVSIKLNRGNNENQMVSEVTVTLEQVEKTPVSADLTACEGFDILKRTLDLASLYEASFKTDEMAALELIKTRVGVVNDNDMAPLVLGDHSHRDLENLEGYLNASRFLTEAPEGMDFDAFIEQMYKEDQDVNKALMEERASSQLTTAVIFGGEACVRYEQTDEIDVEWITDGGGSILLKTFDSEVEKIAYFCGLDDMVSCNAAERYLVADNLVEHMNDELTVGPKFPF